METLEGFDIKDTLYAEGHKMVCHAIRQHDKSRVILKIVSSETSTLSDILRLRNEYELIKKLDFNGIVRHIDIRETHEGVAIILDYFDGMDLRDYLNSNELELNDFLLITRQLSGILAELHKRRIIHKDIKPDNILINPVSKEIRLIDFGIAVSLSQETIGNFNHNELEGSLHYISPEQTGRMNRSVDYRTDFYSLGIMLYEMLGRKKPYESKDPMELLHSHLAKTPVLLTDLNAAIPKVLENIIFKLIEKAPEKRYQNALGLKFDIDNCISQLEQNKKINLFNIGEKDLSDRFLISQHLYGREEEISYLVDTFNTVTEGTPALMLVSGFSGIGKSALIREIHKPITEKRGNFISGKFEQFSRDIPYSAVIEAFSKSIQLILSENDRTIQFWKENILEAVGVNGQIIINVIPQIELIIGKQPAVAELSAAESQNRFNYIFLKFAQIIAKKEHPLVLFIDDLQWADLPSLKLIELLLTEKENNYLLVIGAYRSNEVDSTHPLLKTIATLEENECSIKKIELKPLPLSDLNQLISDTLHCAADAATPIAKLIMSKTGGNPFFVNEFLKSLYTDKLIVFDYSNNSWEWDIEKITQRNITGNVVELMSGKIKLLDEKAQMLCRFASCIGNKFELGTLAAVYEKTPAQTAADLWPAIQEGLILPAGNNYRLAESLQIGDALMNVAYKFLHDQVQNAAYSLIDSKTKQQLHLSIGSQLLANADEENKNDKLFDIVNQLNMAIPLIRDEAEIIKLARLNLQAGEKAKDAAAYSPAYKYLKTGIDILPAGCWKNHYQLSLDLYNEGAEAAYLNSNPEEMERIISTVLGNTTDVLHSVKAYIIKAQAYVSLTRNEDALNTSLEILIKLGVKLPENSGKLNIISSLLVTKFKLRGKTREQLLELPEMKDPKQAAIMEIFSTAASPAYFAKPDLFPVIVFNQIQLSVKYGNHLHSCFAWSMYGLIMCGSTNEFDEGQKFGQLAVGLLNKFNAKTLYAKTHYLNGFFIRIWKEHYKDVVDEMTDAYQKALETGDFLFASYSAFCIQSIGFYTGIPLPELKRHMDDYAAALRRIKQDVGLGWLNIYRQTVENLLNTQKSSAVLTGSIFNESTQKEIHISAKDHSGLCVFYMNKMLLSYLFEKPADAVANGVESMKLIDNVLGGAHVPMVHFYYALSHLRLAGEDKRQKTALIKKAKQSIAKIKMWAKTSPANHLSKQYIVEAELNRVAGKTANAVSLYSWAISEASKNKYLSEEALANELLARLYLSQNDHIQFKKYIHQAKQLYIKWGAFAKVNFMDEYFSLTAKTEFEERQRTTDSIINDSTVNKSGKKASAELDMSSLNKASLAISGEIVLNNLMAKLMQVVIENAGAQNGYLIIRRNDNWFIETRGVANPVNDERFEAMLLENNTVIPENIVNYVLRTNEDLVIDDIYKDRQFSSDAAVSKAISVLCLPIINQGRLIAILYADNTLHSGVFTQQRVQFLKLLSGQIAVSLQNALLYENLEQKVVERTQQLASEKKKSDDLLLNILPSEVAEELKQTGSSEARQYDQVTVLFTDFVDFTKISETLTAKDLVYALDNCFKDFDEIIERNGLEKIKTIGDSYMAVCGLPVKDQNHAAKALHAAIEIRDYIGSSKSPLAGQAGKAIRIGLHSGTVVAGIVGNKKFAYDIWGDTVNTASRMETKSNPGRINISGATYELVKDKFVCEHRGKLEVKNKGMIDMYFVDQVL